MKASPAAVPSTASTTGGRARAISSPSSSSIAPSAPSVTATRPSRRDERLELVAVHDRDVRIHRDRSRRGCVQAEDARARLPRREHRGVGDLELAENGVVRGKLDLAERRVRAGSDDDLVLTGGVDEDESDPGRLLARVELQRDVGGAQPGERFLRERIAADRADERHVRAQSRARDRLVRALPAGHARERGSGHGLARSRQALAPRDEVEVDRPDDRDSWLHAARARRSSTVELKSVSRRSKSPAQSDERSGGASRLAAVARPSSARTSTASSR